MSCNIDVEELDEDEYNILSKAAEISSVKLGKRKERQDRFVNDTPAIKKYKLNFPLQKIISGGQTGADLGGLMAGKDLNIEIGGTAPIGFLTNQGVNLRLGSYFGLMN